MVTSALLSLILYSRWRNIALSTPRLWNKIYCIRPEEVDYELPYWEEGRQGAAAFLARSRPFPVEINILGFVTEDDFSLEFIQLVCDHIGHCRHLSITLTTPHALLKALEHLSRQAVPVLSSIELAIGEPFDEMNFELGLLFPLGAPHLTTVQLHTISPSSLHFCLPAFTHVASLQLTGIWVEDDGYKSLRDTLMALRSLNHLELQLDCFDMINPHLPMVLPNMRFLQVEGKSNNACLDGVIHSIHAESLTTLFIKGRDGGIPEVNLFSEEEELEYSHCFPSLQHLILRNISPYASDLRGAARRFPGIERLTCQARALPYQPTSDIYCRFITQIRPRSPFSDLEDEEENGGGGNIAPPSDHKCWPKLHTIAMTAYNDRHRLNVVDLHLEVSRLQRAGHLIRKLELPHDMCLRASAQAMARLREVVEVEDFSMDWPTPFEKFI
ncbi:hypothetical protein FIBSPDRAFT_516704 [Athelia psychrophila]|uniref:F-box domain-containing protein n=1 Tax=Athelia psychrophila TaxID=1759441 RepID=A0A166V5I2_9AGAM|nr:hypothetical protein FIBSPDRAFT_516704 [Fibularhizoctonia sp. CBS 109695]